MTSCTAHVGTRGGSNPAARWRIRLGKPCRRCFRADLWPCLVGRTLGLDEL